MCNLRFLLKSKIKNGSSRQLVILCFPCLLKKNIYSEWTVAISAPRNKFHRISITLIYADCLGLPAICTIFFSILFPWNCSFRNPFSRNTKKLDSQLGEIPSHSIRRTRFQLFQHRNPAVQINCRLIEINRDEQRIHVSLIHCLTFNATDDERCKEKERVAELWKT